MDRCRQPRPPGAGGDLPALFAAWGAWLVVVALLGFRLLAG